MTWAEQLARAEELGVRLQWPSGEDGDASEEHRNEGDASATRGYFLGQLPDNAAEDAGGTVPMPAPEREASTSSTELDRVLRDGARRFESLVGNYHAELQDAVAAQVGEIEDALAIGTDEMNRAADQRVIELEQAVDARLAELQEAAVNERIAELAARVAIVGRLAVVAVIISILALGAAVAALAGGFS